MGGMASDSSGKLYFTVRSKAQNDSEAQVVSLTSAGAFNWKWKSPCNNTLGNMMNVPTLSPDGTRLFIGSDQGRIYCLNTTLADNQSDHLLRIVWRFPLANQSALNGAIRSGVAHNQNAPGGAAIYFLANDGKVYALDPITGLSRWTTAQGNPRGVDLGHSEPPHSYDHPEAMSATPVIGSDNRVYVGSANGRLYSIDPGLGTVVWSIRMDGSDSEAGEAIEPIESTPAIGQSGWVYVATRSNPDAIPLAESRCYAIDPKVADQNPGNPQAAIKWRKYVTGNQPGVVAGLTIDNCGTVLVPDYHDRIKLLGGLNGDEMGVFSVIGKHCQAPAINQQGLVIVATSQDTDMQWPDKRAIRAYRLSDAYQSQTQNPTVAPLWSVNTVAGQPVDDFLGGVLMRAISTGTTWLADANMNPSIWRGRVYRLNSGASLMAGEWPSLGCGNRRQHKALTYPYQVIELGAWYGGDPVYQGVNSVDNLGRAIGYAHGTPSSGMPNDWYGAYWSGGSPVLLGSPYYTAPRDWALAANLAGNVVGYRSSGPIVWPGGLSGGYTANALALPGGYTGGEAHEINASSSIIGHSFSAGKPKVILWDKSGSTWIGSEIGAPSPGDEAYAYALSDSKRICGKAKFSVGGGWQGYTTGPGISDFSQVTPIGGFQGGLSSEASDVNDLAGTAGWAHKLIGGFNYRRAFRLPRNLYSLSASNELPGYPGLPANGVWQSEAWGVAACGRVVGRGQIANSTSTAYRALLWQPGATAATDLSALAPAGWVLTVAWCVSDTGYIVGSGTRNGATRQWMMYPQPVE